MILKSLRYTRYPDDPREWKIIGKSKDNSDDTYADFENINLLVGKNASGKSRTLVVINEIAELLAENISIKDCRYPSEQFDLIFLDDNETYEYQLYFEDRKITSEILKINGKIFIDRVKKEIVNIKNKKITVFEQLEEHTLMASLRNENGKYYFEVLTEWGKSLKNYMFANQIEKNHYVKDYENADQNTSIDDPNILIYVFHRGKKIWGKSFVSEVRRCMSEVGYSLTDIGIQETKKGFGIYVEEGRYTVSQREMSQGMFRALSLFVLLTYTRMSDISICILVDDLGEGLDYDRSNRLIDIVIKKIKDSNIQFFITTNDRHIMNKIPLRYWTVIDRNQEGSVFYNYSNSKEMYDDFKYTGLNNFDFLATDFYCNGFGDEEE